ncbi:MAG: protein kinase [Kofleriaceae bacterium]
MIRVQDDPTLTAAPQNLPSKVRDSGTDYPELTEVDSQHYSIEKELARGGMGRIFQARDRRLGRTVAIKELLVQDAGLAVRFEREARITARLQHPAIVNVHEAGRWANGAPFYAMQLVSGKPLDRVIDAATSLRQRLAMLPNVIAAADALAYAHAQRVIHRDLKPSNVLVGDYGETVVIDWGLAKDLSSGEQVEPAGPYRGTPADSAGTVAGSVLGTPAYMPPEQAYGDNVDERADVYSLGALLYHVLAGEPPYRGESSRDLLEKVAAAPPVPLVKKVPDLPPDLAAIVTKAMAREPGDRFANANELAQELKKFSTGQLVSVHRYSLRELLGRWIKRHKAAIATALVLIAVLMIVGISGVLTIARARDEARQQRMLGLYEAGRKELADDHPARARAYLDAAWDAGMRSPTLALMRDDVRASMSEEVMSMDVVGGLDHVMVLGSKQFAAGPHHALEMVLLELGHRSGAVSEQANLLALEDHGGTEIVGGGSEPSIDLEGSPVGVSETGRAITRTDSAVVLWNTVTKQPIVTLTDRDHAVLATWGGVPAMVAMNEHGHDTHTVAAYALADGKFLGSADVVPGNEAIEAAETVEDMYLAPDLGWLAVLSSPPTNRQAVTPTDIDVHHVAVVELATGKVSHMAFQSQMLAGLAVGPEGHVYLWDRASVYALVPPEGTMKCVVPLDGVKSVVGLVADHRHEFVVLANDRVAVYDEVTGARSHVLDNHSGKVIAIAGETDSEVVLGGDDGRISTWHPTLHSTMSTHAETLAVSATEQVTLEGGVVKLGSKAVASGAHAGEVAWSTRMLATMDEVGAIRLQSLDGGTAIAIPAKPARALAFDREGKQLATIARDGVEIWNLRGESVAKFSGESDSITAWQWVSGGKMFVTGGTHGQVILWTIGGTERTLEQGNTSAVGAIATANDWIAVASGDGSIRVHTTFSSKARTFVGHGSTATAVALSPDGTMLASGGADGTIKLWQLSDKSTTPHMIGQVDHGQAVASLEFRADSGVLLSSSTANGTGVTRLWDARRAQLLMKLGQAGRGQFVAMDSIAIRGAGGTTVFHVKPEQPVPTLNVWTLEDGRLTTNPPALSPPTETPVTYDFSGDTITATPLPRTLKDPVLALQTARAAKAPHDFALAAPETQEDVAAVTAELMKLDPTAVVELAQRYAALARIDDAFRVIDQARDSQPFALAMEEARLAWASDRPDRLVRASLAAAAAAKTDDERTQFATDLETHAQGMHSLYYHTRVPAYGEDARALLALLAKQPHPPASLEKYQVSLAQAMAEQLDGGSADKARIRRVFVAARPALEACYTRALLDNPKLQGTIETQFTIDLTGHVDDVKVSSIEGGGVLGACVAERIRHMTFLIPGRRLELNYPFTFRPE